jgi:hypothetical protein
MTLSKNFISCSGGSPKILKITSNLMAAAAADFIEKSAAAAAQPYG